MFVYGHLPSSGFTGSISSGQLRFDLTGIYCTNTHLKIFQTSSENLWVFNSHTVVDQFRLNSTTNFNHILIKVHYCMTETSIDNFIITFGNISDIISI